MLSCKRMAAVTLFLTLFLIHHPATAEDNKTACDPYTNYSCLNDYMGGDFLTRLGNYYKLEMGHAAAPADPNAVSSHRDGWPATPESTPPMPFTEWPYGPTTSIGVSQPNAVDSPLMAALDYTVLGAMDMIVHF